MQKLLMQKKGLGFWVMLAAMVVMAAPSVLATKTLYHTKVFSGPNNTGLQGTAQVFITCTTGDPFGPCLPPGKVIRNFMARGIPSATGQVTHVYLTPIDHSWQVDICENGGDAGDCTYDGLGVLDVEMEIGNAMLIAGNVPGNGPGSFASTLSNNQMLAVFVGTFGTAQGTLGKLF